MSYSPFNAEHRLYLTADEITVMRLGQTILTDAAFEMQPGNAIVLRGGNGTGKTSLLRAIAGFAKFSGDLAFSDGESLLDAASVRADGIHFLGHENALSHRLSVRENLTFWQDYLGHDDAPDMDIILFRIGLTQMADMPAGRLSAGQKRRLALARLIMAPKALWLLDEPAAALDREGVQVLSTLIRDHRAQGGMVIISAHDSFVPEDAMVLVLGAEDNLLTGFADSAEFDVKTNLDQFQMPEPISQPIAVTPFAASVPEIDAGQAANGMVDVGGEQIPNPSRARSVPVPKAVRVPDLPFGNPQNKPPADDDIDNLLPIPRKILSSHRGAVDPIESESLEGEDRDKRLTLADIRRASGSMSIKKKTRVHEKAQPSQSAAGVSEDIEDDALPDIIPDAVLKMLEAEKKKP